MDSTKIQHIKLITGGVPNTGPLAEKDVDASKIFDAPFCQVLEIRLRCGAVLRKHQADVPITVCCLSGEGVFRAGTDLSESLELGPGTIIALDSAIDHEVTANSALHLIVTKFKDR